ncbi:MAG: hypothetical protein IJT50_12225 [Lentisphaeria bacterium]|nr:hypothetical protein [Lentisphaeria bacterium]
MLAIKEAHAQQILFLSAVPGTAHGTSDEHHGEKYFFSVDDLITISRTPRNLLEKAHFSQQ